MADVTPGTILRVQRGCTFTFTDATSGTPNTIRLRARSGTITITPGGTNIVRATNEDGDYIGGARDGNQAGVSTVSFAVKLFDCGGDATTPAMIDYCWRNDGSGTALDGWTTTDTDGDIFAMDFAVAIPVRGGAGGTYSLSDIIPQPGASLSNAEDGWELSGTFESPDKYPTITKTT